MIPFRPLSGQSQAFFALFVSLALAALQNVTVDDAVLTGAVVPQYLPTASTWNVGNNCTVCLVRPDPALAYNGTWHDATYTPTYNYAPVIQFTFTGSALYIFFILANNVPNATTFTDVEFVLDNGGAAVSTYIHSPGPNNDYQYNVPVYANDSLGSGQHSMMIQPVNSQNNVLILFDYLIYTTDTSSSVSPFATATSTGTQGTSSGPNIGAIVGGAAGGVAALVLVTVSLLCYRRHKSRNGSQPSAEEEAAVEPFRYSVEAATASLVAAIPSIYPTKSPFAEPLSSADPSTMALLPTILPASTTEPSSSGVQSGTNPDLVEQVEQLRDEVARLRGLHEAPPEYSMDQVEWTE